MNILWTCELGIDCRDTIWKSCCWYRRFFILFFFLNFILFGHLLEIFGTFLLSWVLALFGTFRHFFINVLAIFWYFLLLFEAFCLIRGIKWESIGNMKKQACCAGCTEFLNVTVSWACERAKFSWVCAKSWELYVQTKNVGILTSFFFAFFLMIRTYYLILSGFFFLSLYLTQNFRTKILSMQKNLLLECLRLHTALHKWGGAHQTSDHLPKPNL